METATQANPHNRELTSSEIKLAVAQIEDRLMRIVKAHEEIHAYVGCCDYDPPIECSPEYTNSFDALMASGEGLTGWEAENRILNAKAREIRAKHDIPDGVYLFYSNGLDKHTARLCKPLINAFVRGKLTERSFADLYFFFEERAECDWGWILIERPMRYYDLGEELNASVTKIDPIVEELKSIGTRSRNKNTSLALISGWVRESDF